MKSLLKCLVIFCAIILISRANRQIIGIHSISSFRHAGMNDILVNGKRVHIHFSQNSDREKASRLCNLNPFIPNDRIIYTGVPHDEWHTVPDTAGDGNALYEAGEKYGDRTEFVTRKDRNKKISDISGRIHST